MNRFQRTVVCAAFIAAMCSVPVWMTAQTPQQTTPPAQPPQQGRGGAGAAGGAGRGASMPSLETIGPARVVSSLFSQEAYTEYALLEPGSESFRIRYLPEVGPGATELSNATRGGSEGSGIEVYDPRTGDPLKFTYTADSPSQPDVHTIHATLPMKVPPGGIGRVLIYKTYKDDRTYRMDNEDIAWVRSLAGYRLGVVLPKGFAFISSDVAAQLSTTEDGRLRIAFANPSGQSNPVTIHARKTTAAFAPIPYTDMFFDDIKTLYDLGLPETGVIKVEETYSDYRKGASAKLDSLGYLPLNDLKVTDLDTAEVLTPVKAGTSSTVKLGVSITNDKQSAHLRINGTISDGSYKLVNGDLTFERTLHGLRNTILLPAGWELSGCSQSGIIGLNQGRTFVALINLNAENNYKVTIHARKRQ
jgi:hypothetical protein